MMTLPRTAADVLSEHVVFEVESIDRMYLNVYVPELQRVGQVVGFLTRHRGFEIASTALVAPMSKDFVAGIGRYAADHHVPVIDFVKGQRKDDVMHEYLARSDGSEGVLFIGRAQEKARIFRTERRHNPTTGVAYPWIVPATAMVNHFYFYAVDDDFGPFFLKFCSYFPYTARLCINGNEYAKRQATKAGIAFTALDNGFAAVDDVAGVQAICDGLTEQVIDALPRKWLARLPHPFTPADHAADYRYEVSILQAEFSLTQMLDKPVSGRIFFEQAIRDNLDIGRPDQVSLIFNRQVRRNTPGTFRTRVITDTVTPSLHVDYKHCRIKQYHKEGKALRTETTINDTYDFAIGKRLTNLPALREIGFSANRRLLRVQRLSHDPADGADALAAITDPITTDTGQRIPAPALHRPPRPSPALRTMRISPAAPRLHQPRPAHPPRTPTRTTTRAHDQRADHLRPQTAPRSRPHRTYPRHPPISRHRPRPESRPIPHPRPHPTPTHRTRPTPRPTPTLQTPHCSPRLRSRHHQPHPNSQPHSLNPTQNPQT
jgi:hypothetical protein